MNRRGFLKSLFTFVGVTAVAPELLLEEPTTPLLAPFKGRVKYDAGYFYCPYIPLQISDIKDIIGMI